jgi:hypothetical protein
MEEPTLNNSATPAKHADCVPRDEALLARLQHEWDVVLSESDHGAL